EGRSVGDAGRVRPVDDRRGLVNGQRAVVDRDGVVSELAVWIDKRQGDRIGAHGARRRGCAGVGGGDVVTVLHAGDGAGEGRVRGAVLARSIAGRDGQRRLRHGHGAVVDGDGVVSELVVGIHVCREDRIRRPSVTQTACGYTRREVACGRVDEEILRDYVAGARLTVAMVYGSAM